MNVIIEVRSNSNVSFHYLIQDPKLGTHQTLTLHNVNSLSGSKTYFGTMTRTRRLNPITRRGKVLKKVNTLLHQRDLLKVKRKGEFS